MKASLSISITIGIFFAIEILFYSSFAVSDNFGFTLAGQRWAEKYWHPINSFGYRDVEHETAEFDSKQVLFVVGDSFVAGAGIPRIENRFSNILQRNLGEQYVVVNIAKSGWDTGDEYQAILAYSHKPKKIILSYFINDIRGAATRLGYRDPVRVEPPANDIVRYSINNSYSLNFVYWRLYRFHNKALGETYWDYLERSYANQDIWQAHEAELFNIVTYAQEHEIGLIVVVFPNLFRVKGSAAMTSKVAGFLLEHGVTVLNLEPLLGGRDPKSLVVNSLDAHPSEALNIEVAELLTKAMKADSR